MTEGEKLLAIEEIKQLKARYFQCVDCKDWKGFSATFAADVEFDHLVRSARSIRFRVLRASTADRSCSRRSTPAAGR